MDRLSTYLRNDYRARAAAYILSAFGSVFLYAAVYALQIPPTLRSFLDSSFFSRLSFDFGWRASVAVFVARYLLVGTVANIRLFRWLFFRYSLRKRRLWIRLSILRMGLLLRKLKSASFEAAIFFAGLLFSFNSYDGWKGVAFIVLLLLIAYGILEAVFVSSFRASSSLSLLRPVISPSISKHRRDLFVLQSFSLIAGVWAVTIAISDFQIRATSLANFETKSSSDQMGVLAVSGLGVVAVRAAGFLDRDDAVFVFVPHNELVSVSRTWNWQP